MTDPGDAHRRFLGVPADAPPAALLRLGPPPHRRIDVETALRDRLAQVFRHPDGRTPEAERVRQRLRAAAAALLAPAPSAPTPAAAPRTAPPALPLTDFDRHVLAVLVGAGGWNNQSRLRLIALAQTYGVSPGGLFRVIRGLNDYARRGGHFGVTEITAGARALPAPAASVPSTDVAALADRFAPELRDASLWSVVKLSMLFGFVTLLIGLFAVRSALVSDDVTDIPEQAQAPLVGPGSAPPPPPAEAPARTTGVQTPLAEFRPLPTFLGNTLPPEATDAADACPQIAGELDDVARRLAITDDPAEVVYRRWRLALDTAASGWVLVSPSVRDAIARGVVAVLMETADAPDVSDRLLGELLPPRPRATVPVDQWRGAWRAGMLGAISARDDLPPSVVQQARRLLGVALGERAAAVDGFDAGATAWLDGAATGLVDRLELEADVFDAWEAWLAAERRLEGGERFQAAITGAIESILASPTDLARVGPSVKVLGRLLTVADFESSRLVQSRVRAWFDDRDRITDHDLWVVTSLLARLDTAPWFGTTLVLPDEAGPSFRNRIRDRIVSSWPALAAPAPETGARRGIPVDPTVGGRWVSVQAATAALLVPRDDAGLLMEQLLALVRVSEAAALLAAQRTDSASRRLDEVAGDVETARGSPGRPFVGAPGRPVGQALGPDGDWSAQYEETRRNTEEKLRLLRSLRTRAGTDLGPIDAETMVRAFYRGTPAEVRSLARAVVVEQFASGPTVALELLDQFPDAPRNESVSEAIRRVTGRLLPAARGEAWSVEARLALVGHVLGLRSGGPSPLDQQAGAIAETFLRRAALVRRDQAGNPSIRAADDAARQLAEAWRGRAEMALAVDPVPTDLAGLARRRQTRRELADGPIQRMVGEQLSVLEALAYVTVVEQPDTRDAVLAILAESAGRRRATDHVIAQSIEAERAVTRLWRLRLDLGTAPEGAP